VVHGYKYQFGRHDLEKSRVRSKFHGKGGEADKRGRGSARDEDGEKTSKRRVHRHQD